MVRYDLCHIAVLVFDHTGHRSVAVLFIERGGNLLHFFLSSFKLFRVVVAQNVVRRSFRDISSGTGQMIKAFPVLCLLGYFI